MNELDICERLDVVAAIIEIHAGEYEKSGLRPAAAYLNEAVKPTIRDAITIIRNLRPEIQDCRSENDALRAAAAAESERRNAPPVTGGLWRHYKGGVYWVRCRAAWVPGVRMDPAWCASNIRWEIAARWHEDPAPMVHLGVDITGEQGRRCIVSMPADDPRQPAVAPDSPIIIYQDVGTGRHYARPEAEWRDVVEVGGVKTQRFVNVDE